MLLRDDSQPVVAVQIWVKVGVWNETPEINGISHFIEHMLFKGTTSRPVNAIQEEVESKGGFLNGATSKDFTYYQVSIPGEYWSEALAVLSDMVQNASFDPVELEKERKVVRQEIDRQNDEPMDYLWNEFSKQLFKQLPYRMTPLGTSTTLNSLTRDAMIKYYRTYYRPENMTVVLVGDFSEKDALNRINELFPGKTGTATATSPAVKTQTENNENSIPLNYELPFKVDLAYQVIGFLGPTIENPDSYALDVAAVILGQGRSSRLNQDLHEDQQLVFSVESGFMSQRSNGVFYVDCVYTPNKINEVSHGVLKEIKTLMISGVTDAELNKAKAMIESAFVLENQTAEDKASSLGYYATVYNIDAARQYLERIEAVTKEDVKQVVLKYLTENYVSILLKPAPKKVE